MEKKEPYFTKRKLSEKGENFAKLIFDEIFLMAAVQLAEWSLPTPEIRGSNPDIGNKILKRSYLSIAIQKKTKKRNKEWPNKKNFDEISLTLLIAQKN